MTTYTIEQFHQTLKEQNVPKEHLAFKCVVCGTIQSGFDLIKVGAGKDFESIEGFLGFSCIGRWTNAGEYKKKKSKKASKTTIGCNWTLGGLFTIHKVEILMDQKLRPCFELATPQEAQNHMKKNLQSVSTST